MIIHLVPYRLASPLTSPAVNAHAPRLHVKGPLVVMIGGTALLDLSVITAEDPDSSSEDLVLQLALPPRNGRLISRTDGREAVLDRDDSFAFTELRNGGLRFTHSKGRSE